MTRALGSGREDARFTMPPLPAWFHGRPGITTAGLELRDVRRCKGSSNVQLVCAVPK